MAFPGAPEVELLITLQDAASGNGDWTGFLARLAELTGARFAVLLTRDPASGGTTTIAAATRSGHSIPIDALALEFVLTARMRPERIYTPEELTELVDDTEGLSLGAAIARLGAVSFRAMRVAPPEADSMTVGIFGTRAFDAADGAVLRRLFPYLQSACRTAGRIGRERDRAAIMAALRENSVLGWFKLDLAGRIWDHWAAPPGLPPAVRLSSSPQGDRLGLAEQRLEAELTAILHHLAHAAFPRDQALSLSHDPRLYLRVTRAPPNRSDEPDRTLVLATLHGGSHAGAVQPGLLVDLFGLLPSEARLAVVLAEGIGLAETARRLGLTIETARNYSKKIYGKMGVSGQAGLVRLVLTNALTHPAVNANLL